jgi:hypothetical protein
LIQDQQAQEQVSPELQPEDQQPDKTECQWLERVLPDELKEFAEVFSKLCSNVLPPHCPYYHKVTIENSTPESIGYTPLQHQSTQELQEIKHFLTENLDHRFIETSQAPYVLPVLFVKKANRALQFCVNFRKLNSLTQKDWYPLPLIDETLARLAKAKIFTKLDICQAFYCIRMDPSSEELTIFWTWYGTYKCKVLWEGLTNRPATYQWYMNNILFDYLDTFCTVYLDDILIYSEDPLEHDLYVWKVLERLCQAGLQVDIKKSEFKVTCTKYLGFIITTNGIEVDPDKITVVKDWSVPTTVRGVQSFLGFCGFYWHFVENYSRITKPLNSLTKKGTAFKWDTACQEAFDQIKLLITTAPILWYYQPDIKTMVEVDASNGVVAGLILQKDPESGLWHPIGYFSSTMQQAELNYNIHNKEMLVIVRALQE